MNARAAEQALTYYNVKESLSALEIVFKIETKQTFDRVLDLVAKRLVDSVPQRFLKSNPFGCCDAGGIELDVRLNSYFLTTEHLRVLANLLPSQYRYLGEKFDKLHSIIFGTPDLCRGLGRALGENATVQTRKGLDWAALRVYKPEMTVVKSTAARWLILSDSDCVSS